MDYHTAILNILFTTTHPVEQRACLDLGKDCPLIAWRKIPLEFDVDENASYKMFLFHSLIV